MSHTASSSTPPTAAAPHAPPAQWQHLKSATLRLFDLVLQALEPAASAAHYHSRADLLEQQRITLQQQLQGSHCSMAQNNSSDGDHVSSSDSDEGGEREDLSTGTDDADSGEDEESDEEGDDRDEEDEEDEEDDGDDDEGAEKEALSTGLDINLSDDSDDDEEAEKEALSTGMDINLSDDSDDEQKALSLGLDINLSDGSDDEQKALSLGLDINLSDDSDDDEEAEQEAQCSEGEETFACNMSSHDSDTALDDHQESNDEEHDDDKDGDDDDDDDDGDDDDDDDDNDEDDSQFERKRKAASTAAAPTAKRQHTVEEQEGLSSSSKQPRSQHSVLSREQYSNLKQRIQRVAQAQPRDDSAAARARSLAWEIKKESTLQDIQRIYNGAITLYTQQRFTAQLMLGKYFQETKRWKDAQQDQQLSSQDWNSFLRTHLRMDKKEVRRTKDLMSAYQLQQELPMLRFYDGSCGTLSSMGFAKIRRTVRASGDWAFWQN